MNREDSIAKMKQQLDEWNVKIGEWEGQMQDAQATMKTRYASEIDQLRQQREEGLRKLKEIGESSEAAWQDLGNGFEEAWKHLAESFEQAWSEFGTKKQNEDKKT